MGALQKITVQNFKAFPEFQMDLQGRNALIFGANGSGKSSLYYSLYTFLEAASKVPDEVQKYFDANQEENLLHRAKGIAQEDGQISISLKSNNLDQQYRLSKEDNRLANHPVLTEGHLASDFITYRFFFGFSDFRNSKKFNIWPLFEKEMLPFAQVGSEQVGQTYEDWQTLNDKSVNPNPYGYKGRAGAKAYRDFNEELASFSNKMAPLFETITAEAQSLFDKHFAKETENVELRFGITDSAFYDQSNKILIPPKLEMALKINGVTIPRPQSYLNEARMTQVALAFRLGATRAKIDSNLQLLVVDDLLVSLDMENRVAALQILLGEDFRNYQKIILTHNRSFFEEAKRRIAIEHTEWSFYKFSNTSGRPKLTPSKTDLEQAEDYFENDQLEECGNRLRKYAEANLKHFLSQIKQEEGCKTLVDRKDFASLHSMLEQAQNHISKNLLTALTKLINQDISDEVRDAIFSDEAFSHNDADFLIGLDSDTKGRVIAKIKGLQPEFWDSTLILMSSHGEIALRANQLLTEAIKIKSSILNPASHSNEDPLYPQEMEDAIDKLKGLKIALNEFENS